MGVGNVGCCDNNTALKNTEFSVQSVTYRENNEDYYFTPTLLLPSSTSNEFQVSNLSKRLKQLRRLINFSTLSVKLINSPTQEVLSIKPSGLIDSKRNIKDGYVFFGCKFKSNGIITNDFKIPVKDPDKMQDLHGRYFMIYYNIDKSSY